MARVIETEVEATVTITIKDDAPDDVLSRGLDKEWSDLMYGPMDEDAVVQHLAFNAVMNGVEDLSRLDGWADIPKGTVKMEVNV